MFSSVRPRALPDLIAVGYSISQVPILSALNLALARVDESESANQGRLLALRL